MLAFFAVIIFALAAFNVHLGAVNLIALGLAVFALYFVVPVGPWAYPNRQ
jgi:hypothetical protein